MAEPAPAEFLLYQTEDGQSRVEVRMAGETVWLNLTQMSGLFGRDKSVVSRHIKNVFDERELSREATVAFYATVQSEGARSDGKGVFHKPLVTGESLGGRRVFQVVPDTLHLREHNHSHRFYRMLDMHMPRWQRRPRWPALITCARGAAAYAPLSARRRQAAA